MSSSSYRSGVPSQRRAHAMPTSNSVMYGGRPRSLGLYNNNNASLSSLLSGTSYLGHATPSYLSGSPSSYLSSSPKGISSYLSSSPKSSAYYSGYSAGSPKSSSLLLSSAYSPSSSLSLSTYGGTTSGYGGLTVSSLSPHRIVSGRSAARSSSFNLRNSKGSTPSSTLSSRSGSWASLAPSSCSGSEGYASGGDLPSPSSRLSNSPSGDSRAVTPAARGSKDVSNENGEIDYKKLYEVTLAEKERLTDLYETTLTGLKEQLKKTESDLQDAKSQLEKLPAGSTKNSLSEMEKRERRAMERKLSEMEEELKQLQKLKAENERLKAENRALTRVVSKLTNSANATK